MSEPTTGTVRRFHFDRGVNRQDALRAIASALQDEGLLLVTTAQGSRIASVREGDFDVYVVPASLIMAEGEARAMWGDR